CFGSCINQYAATRVHYLAASHETTLAYLVVSVRDRKINEILSGTYPSEELSEHAGLDQPIRRQGNDIGLRKRKRSEEIGKPDFIANSNAHLADFSGEYRCGFISRQV